MVITANQNDPTKTSFQLLKVTKTEGGQPQTKHPSKMFQPRNHKLSAWNWWLKWDSCHLVLVTYLSSCFLIDFVEVWIMPSCSASEVNITIHIWIRYMLPALLLSSWFKRNLSGCGSKKTPFRDCQQRSPKKQSTKKHGEKNPLQGTNYIKLYVLPISEDSPFSNHQLPAVATKRWSSDLDFEVLGSAARFHLLTCHRLFQGKTKRW